MDFWGDRRGQPVQIGFILLFGILVLAFASYQGYVVPSQNANIEVNHFETVEDQFAEFDTNAVNAVGTDVERSSSFALGVQYPSRLIALNPPPVSGRLETTEPRQVSVVNDTGHGKTQQICGSDRATSRSLVYTPQYHEYGEIRSLTYENTFVTRSFRERDLHGEQRLVRSVDGGPDRIDLLLLNRSVSVDRQGTYSLKLEGTHRYSKTVENATVTIATQYSNTTWEEEILADRDDVSASDAGTDRVELEFTGGDYEVSCAVVGLNGKPAFEPPGDENTGPVFSTFWNSSDPVTVNQGNDEKLKALVERRGSTTRIDNASVDFALDAGIQPSVAELIDADTATSDGVATVTVDTKDGSAGQKFQVYVSSGDSSDALTLSIVDKGVENPFISDLTAGENQSQTFAFDVVGEFQSGDEVQIDLSEAQSGGENGVDYGDASAQHENAEFTGTAVITYTATGDESDGDTLQFEAVGVDAGSQSTGTYTVTFTEPDGETVETTFEVY